MPATQHVSVIRTSVSPTNQSTASISSESFGPALSLDSVRSPENSPEGGMVVTSVALGRTLNIGCSVDNHRVGKDQEDRHLVRDFPLLTKDQAETFLQRTIAGINEVTKLDQSGSTFTGVIVTQEGNVVTAHLGDSPASAITISKRGAVKGVVPLTRDHKPGVEESVQRAPDGTAYVDWGGYRVVGDNGLAMTRALGDSDFRGAISHEPEIGYHRLQDSLKTGDRLFLLVTSDGAHNEKRNITHKTHATLIREGLLQNQTLDEIAKNISDRSKPIGDNVTVLLLEVEPGKGAVACVFDGHCGAETSALGNKLFEVCVMQCIAESARREASPDTPRNDAT